MARDPRSPLQPPPDRFELYVCRTCGAWDLAPELDHLGYFPERRDPSHVDYVVAERVHIEPYVGDRG